MKFITLDYGDEKYKINLEKVSMIQIRESYICITFTDDDVCEIQDYECLNFKEVKKILENL